jgi:hypothetical protein
MLGVIAFHIRGKLGLPEFGTIGGHCREATAGMPMPEASMHEHNRLPTGQNDIGATW